MPEVNRRFVGPDTAPLSINHCGAGGEECVFEIRLRTAEAARGGTFIQGAIQAVFTADIRPLEDRQL